MGIEVLIPPSLPPSDEQPQLIDDAVSVFRPNQAPGIPQRVSFVEPRLQVKQSWKALRGTDRSLMMQAISKLQGKYGTLRATVGYTLRGSFPTAELVPQTIYTGVGTTGGTATFQSADRILRVTNAASITNFYLSAGIVQVTSGAAYVARALTYSGRNVAGRPIGPVVGSAAGAANYLDARTVTDGFKYDAFIASTSSVFVGLSCGSTSQAGDYFESTYLSLARCAIVTSIVAANAMMVGALPTSAAALLNADDLFVINGELKRCTAQLDSDSTGRGYLQYAPTMFRAPSSGDAVEIYQPIGQFILAANPSWTNQFGVYADLDLTLEAINQ